MRSVLFSIGGFEVRLYGVCIALAVFAGLLVGLREAKRTGQSVDLYFDFFFIAVAASIVGARLYYVAFSWDEYRGHLSSVFNLRAGGLAIYGAVIASVVSALIYVRVKKYPFWKFADTGVLGLITGQIIGRWGNFFNREAFGGSTDAFSAMYLRTDTVPPSMLVTIRERVSYMGGEYIAVHPTFLYESLWNAALLLGLFLYKKRKAFDGEIFLLYLTVYGIGRFWIEGLRSDSLMLFGTGIAVSQGLSALLTLFGIGMIVYKRLTKRPATDAPISASDHATSDHANHVAKHEDDMTDAPR